MRPEVINQSIGRLESFLSYLSEKIKSNTLKISSANEPEVGQTEDKLSQTTASRSDLSIDEGDLNCFKEYLMHENIKKGGAEQEIEDPKDEQEKSDFTIGPNGQSQNVNGTDELLCVECRPEQKFKSQDSLKWVPNKLFFYQ